MKWKTVLTANEAALFASGIDGFKSIEDAKTAWIFSPIAPKAGQEEDVELGEKVKVAEEIYEALLAEIIVADPSDNQPYLCGATSLLEVAMRSYSQIWCLAT